MNILVLNSGSSSHKSCLYRLQDLPQTSPQPIWQAHLDWTVSSTTGILKVTTANGKTTRELTERDNQKAIATMLTTLTAGKTKVLDSATEIDIVGHRIVHGGAEYSQATRITPEVKAAIEKLIPLAPSHNPAHLSGINAIEELLDDIPQLAVFDTAFHRTLPPVAAVYPIPYEWYQEGIRRYGFHGINHQYCAEKAAQLLDRPLETLKIITCHLGNGCSLAAIKQGKCLDTTMGFTPLEGLMMGTRSGSIDPAILLYLMEEYKFDRDKLKEMLEKKSGLLGISGISADLRNIITAIAKHNEQAQLALDMFIYHLNKAICSLLPVLGGLDVLVFTAGIGENSVTVREKVGQSLEFLGLKLDFARNNQNLGDRDLATSDSTVRVLVIPANENWAIATRCWKYWKDNIRSY
jgi:acetate kinase